MLDTARIVVPIVLHRIVPDGLGASFEDVELSLFRRIAEASRNHCVSLSDPSMSNSSHNGRYLLTFDDGNSSDFEIALPILCEKECIATFFIVTDRIGTPNHLSWSQVRELHESGMSIGSHSVSHMDMRKLDVDSQHKELQQSRLSIEDKLGVAVTAFSFPFGKFNEKLIHLARDAGYSAIFTSKHGVTNFSEPYLPRNSINGSMTWESISRTLEASSLIRCGWFLEDMLKDSVRWALGDKVYRTMRSLVKGG